MAAFNKRVACESVLCTCTVNVNAHAHAHAHANVTRLREVNGRPVVTGLGHRLAIHREDHLDVARARLVRVDATVGTVCAAAHLGRALDLCIRGVAIAGCVCVCVWVCVCVCMYGWVGVCVWVCVCALRQAIFYKSNIFSFWFCGMGALGDT